MRILITTGPSYAPIDHVRRITNFATGQIGSLLAQRLLAEGHSVFLARGEGSTAPAPHSAPGLVVEEFGTNDDLDELLKEWSRRHAFDAVFHAAALGDFRVKEIHMPQEAEYFNDTDGDHDHASVDADDETSPSVFGEDETPVAALETNTDSLASSLSGFKDKAAHEAHEIPRMPAKIGSDTKVLHIVLTPTKKLLPLFRQRFGSKARIVGWKYELDGSREVAVGKALRQIEKCDSNASVVNGRAYGDGFGICLPGGTVHHCENKAAMVDWLTQWLGRGI